MLTENADSTKRVEAHMELFPPAAAVVTDAHMRVRTQAEVADNIQPSIFKFSYTTH